MKLEIAFKILALMAALSFASGCATTSSESGSVQPESTAAADEMKKESMDSMAEETYVVATGDHLWGISAKSMIYGNPYKWPLIYRANSNKIEDADLIYPGQELVIDRGYTLSDELAAERHARSRGAWSLGAVEQGDKDYLSNNMMGN